MILKNDYSAEIYGKGTNPGGGGKIVVTPENFQETIFLQSLETAWETWSRPEEVGHWVFRGRNMEPGRKA